MPQSMHNKLATLIALTRDAVISGLRRVCNIIGMFHSHNRAPPTQNRIFSGTLCVAKKWNLISHALPKTPLTTSSARLLTLFTPLWEILILNYGQTFLHLSLNSHLDPLHYCMAPPRQPISLWK
ncbi:hypothetical protein TcG_13422 [Trypanosoma cruzi]|nr:hypothetical protein TcG_13422 [Trypanosoma cruzi]